MNLRNLLQRATYQEEKKVGSQKQSFRNQGQNQNKKNEEVQYYQENVNLRNEISNKN